MPLACSYEDFREWLETYHGQYVRAAGDAVLKALNEYLDQELTLESERVRVRVAPPRLKGVSRTWRKIHLEKYADRIAGLEDVPAAIDDLLGLRIVCTNTSDEARVIELLKALPVCPADSSPVLGRVEGSDRDYLTEPKGSGYRAWHINVETSVAHVTTWRRIICEVQVRTLLQDSWGELTHEDTYKPGGGGIVSPLVRTLSRRMADLLATLDDIAEDLRQELDLLNAEAAEEEAAQVPDPGVSDEATPGRASLPAADSPIDSDPVRAYLLRRVSQLDRPLDLASLAWEAQREFGQDILNGWAGHGTFKNLLRAAVPGVRLTAEPPTYVVPEGFSIERYSKAAREDGAPLPRAALALKSLDGSFPAVPPDALSLIFRAFAEGTRLAAERGEPDVRFLNETTRLARDWSASIGSPVSRRLLNFVGKALLGAGELRPNMSEAQVRSAFRAVAVSRARDLLVLTEQDEQELSDWLDAGSAEEGEGA